MPRLLPRLLKWLEHNPLSQPDYRGPLLKQSRRSRRSLWRPTPSADEFTEAYLLPNRRRSIVLDEDNIFTSREKNTRHKRLPPVLKLQKNQEGLVINNDTPREMTEQEKQWWSSPYLRMLSSSFRRCMVSGKHLPTDFLIRLVALRMPRTRTSPAASVLVPDGILHPKFAKRAHGTGHYLTCWNKALDWMIKKEVPERIYKNAFAHSLLSEQIGHQLRLRVLQELELLVYKLKVVSRTTGDGDVVLRRLTRTEWTTMKSTGNIPWPGASCVLVVPPVNRDPRTKQRAQPNYSNTPPEETSIDSNSSEVEGKTLPPLPELSVLYPTEPPNFEEPLDFLQDSHLPQSRVPLYNGLTLFPSRTQRAALHEKLCELLGIERQKLKKRRRHTDDKSSHAFVLFSTAKTLSRVDTVPLLIALWRIRMWEGAGWGDCYWTPRTQS
ncbi:uncharacterized protein FOMMEDRAFT_29923 [Fomitiporia mediterranea MF3/22]|uniref:uncharacterized protein n=1 Tax=Fomitiporia mediterranea (strain MF3/22) TaxID=694068 RepID=UPI0004408767|nr:uncharacterized protein FOMMEDRAFT_29923 [Fomitiporia mediterranea MF3/22]EJD01176.1 hypothetical protein FOMMEDRAFT_29923 [Fomitiporia mediterranea MF3/22]